MTIFVCTSHAENAQLRREQRQLKLYLFFVFGHWNGYGGAMCGLPSRTVTLPEGA